MEDHHMRVDLYWDVHKGLRYELFNLLSHLGRLDVADDEAVEAFRSRIDGICTLLADHAAHEESAVHPLLEAQYAELGAALAADHEALERSMESMRRAVGAIGQADAAGRGAAGAKAYRVLSAFVGAYVAHMGREEGEAMAALWGLYDDSRLMEVQNQIRGSIAPPRMAAFMSIMIPAMNIEERTTLFAGLRDHAPPEAFAGMCGLAEVVLTDAEWSAVQARVGI